MNLQTTITTVVKTDGGMFSWLMCAGLFILGFCLLVPFFICWIPFCIKPLMDTHHSCPNCHKEIGVFPALGVQLSK